MCDYFLDFVHVVPSLLLQFKSAYRAQTEGHPQVTKYWWSGDQASRSPVFKAMFEHELKEKTCALIHVADVPTPAMRALLLYLYTGSYTYSPDMFTLVSPTQSSGLLGMLNCNPDSLCNSVVGSLT